MPPASLKTIANKFWRTKNVRKVLGKEEKELQAKLLERLEAKGVNGISVPLDGGDGDILTATVVRASTVDIDTAELERRLKPDQWDAITVQVVDSTLLEDAMANGVVEPDDVVQCSITKPKAPYVRMSLNKGGVVDDEEEETEPAVVTRARKRRSAAGEWMQQQKVNA